MRSLAPELDMANALAAAADVFQPPLALDADIKLGPPRAPLSAGNSAAVWLMPYGGREPDPLVDAASQGSLYYSKVQVLVRSPADGYDGGLARARQCRLALHARQPSEYIYWRALSSEPLYLGIDENQEHRFALNLEAAWWDAAP